MSIDADAYVLINDGAKHWIGQPCDIIRLDQDGNYTVISTSNGEKLMVCHGLGKYEESLPLKMFTRTGRSCLINLAHVKQIKKTGKRFFVVMSDGSEVVMSRQQSSEFRKLRSL